MDSSMKFSTVIVARDTSQAPSQLEVKLQLHAKKLRVVEPLSNGAEFLCPSADTTVAIRVFDEAIIKDMEQKHSTEIRLTFSNEISQGVQTQVEAQGTAMNLDDFCGIKTFRDAFKHTMVFFVLSSEAILTDQIGRMDSFVNSLQRCLSLQSKNQNGIQQKEKGNTRVHIVPDIDAILPIISMTLRSLDQDKRSQKAAFFQKQAETNFLPDEAGQLKPSNHISKHVSNAFRMWSSRMDVPVDDANVIMHFLGSLEKIRCASEDELNEVPVHTSTKHSILNFFRSRDDDNCNGGLNQNIVQKVSSSEHSNCFLEATKSTLSFRESKGELNSSQLQDPCNDHQPQQALKSMDFQQEADFYGNDHNTKWTGAQNINYTNCQRIVPFHLHTQTTNENISQILHRRRHHDNSNNHQIISSTRNQTRYPIITQRHGVHSHNCSQLLATGTQNNQSRRQSYTKISNVKWSDPMTRGFHPNF